MPVIGHAFVGMATAMSVTPPRDAPRVAALWLPAVVLFSYLPDITNQLAQLVGLGDARIVTHSILFAVVASAIAALFLAGRGGMSGGRAFLLILFCVLVHDGLDILQASDRAPFWPFVDRSIVLQPAPIPQAVSREAIIFAGLFAMFVIVRWTWQRISGAPPALMEVRRDYLWAGRIGLVLILIAASATHLLRGVRLRELQEAEALLQAARYQDAIVAAERAKRWPTAAKPGRADYFEAQAYAELGDAEQAETRFRRAAAADESYFWSRADYAIFVAGDERRLIAQRRLEAGEMMERLKQDFAGEPNLERQLAKVRRRLAAAADAH